MGKYESFTAAAGGEGAAEPQVIRADGDTVIIPDAHLLFSGNFSRSGSDLVIAGEGQSVVVADYFGDAGMPTLTAPNGAVLLPDVVSALAGPLAPGQYAQADDGEPAQGIGSVVSLTGSATAQRGDGTVVDLTVDSRLGQGDVVQTASGSALSIVFDDGAVFNLNADSRMVLNELVYEPGGDSNSMLFSMVQGVFAFVAGQVAPTGEMRIDTPAASMGIRGTSGIVKLETIDGVAVFRVVPDPVTNEVGTIVLYSPGTNIILVVMESSDSQWAVDPATGQVIEQPADPGDADLIEQLHQTYIEFAGIVDDPGEVQFAGNGGSGLPTQFFPTQAEIDAILDLAGGAFPQEEALADEAADPGVEPVGQVAGEVYTFSVLNGSVSSDPQQQPQRGFTGDDFGSVEEDGDPTTGQLIFDGGTGLIEPLVIQGTYGTFEIDADGNWVYTLDNDSEAVQALGEGVSAQETFAVISADGSETQFVTITVQGVNDVPTVTGATAGAAIEDGQVATGTITVDDPDAGESSVQPQSNVAGTYGTFSILADGTWTYTVNDADPAVQALPQGETVTDSFTVTSFDGTVTETVTVTVTGTNDEPTVAGTTAGAALEDGQVATGTITVDDPDTGESSVQPLSDVAGTYGTFSILANGNWTYVVDNADPDVQALAEGETVTDAFTVTSFDGTVTETVTVTVTGTNDEPTVAGATTGEALEDGTQVATGTITVDDPDSGESSVQPLSDVAGSYGTFSILANGNWTYVVDNADPAVQALAEGETVTDMFTVTSFDGTVTETVTVTVTGTNDEPTVAGATSGGVVEDGTQVATGTITVVDPDAGESSVQPLSDVAGTYGTFSILANGNWTYVLDNADPAVQALAEGETVTDMFTVTSFDGTVTETVTVTVTGTNDGPVARNDAVATNENAVVNGNVLADNANGPDEDVDGDPLIITHVNGSTANVGTQIVLASGALLLLNADGSFAYDPNGQFEALGSGESAQDSFSYRVADGHGGRDTATVTLTINGVNDAPVATDSLIATNEGVSASGVLTGMDVDSGTLGFLLEQGPQNGTVVINADGSYEYTPNAGFTGQDSFTFRVTDGQGAFDIATVEIEVAGVGESAAPKEITGTSGNDVLIGSALSDVLTGGLGNDVLRSGGAPQSFFGLDLLNGGPGDDTLIAEGGAAILAGGPGNDVLTRVVTGQPYDFVRANYQSSPEGIVANFTAGMIGTLAPGEVADGFGSVDLVSFMHILNDSAHDDVIHVDDSYSNGQTNFIEVRLSGGDDTVVFDNVAHARIGFGSAGGGVLADLETGTATDLDPGDNFIGSDSFSGKVHVLRGSHFDDVLLGSSGNEAFRGEGGDDYIDGRGGTNIIQFNSSSSGIHVDLSQNLVLNDGIFIDALRRHGIDTLLDIHNVNGSDWNDIIIGDAGNNRLTGGLGDDLLRSGGAPQNFFGADRLFGGEGDDTLIAEGGWVVLEGGSGNDVLTSTDTGGFWDFVRADYQSSPGGIVANLTIGSLGNLASGEVADGFGTVDQVSNVHLIADSPHDDVIHVDYSYTNSFGNWIEVRLSGGNDTVVFDDVSGARISYAQALGPVLIDLETSTGTDRFGGDSIGNDTFVGANSARGSRFDDEIYGRWEANDNLRGSGGDDYIDGRGGTNTITFGDSSFGIHVDLSQNAVLDDGIAHHSLNRHGIDEVHNIQNVSGTTWSDTIIGDAGSNVLSSGGTPDDFFAVDFLDGRGGDDLLVGQGGGVVLVGGLGNDTLASNDSGRYYDWVRADYGTSTTGIVANLTGSFGADSLAPGEVADGFGTVDQLSGMHVLADSAQNDFIHVDWTYTGSFGNFIEVRLSGGDDTVVFDDVALARIGYNFAGGGVLADLEAGTATDLDPNGDFIGSDSFSGKVHILRGSNFNDELYGSSGNEAFRGEGGDDYIDGRGGTNTLQFVSASEGVHVDLSQNSVLNDGHWIDALGRHGIDEVDNIQNVNGSEWDDLIIGGASDNVLRGGLGDDMLIGGPGSDTLEGGAGVDRFGFRSPDDGVDSIIDFAVSEDVLVIDAAVFGGGLVAGQGLSPDQFVSGNGPQPTEAHGQFLYDSVLGELTWDVDGTGGQEAVLLANLAGAPNLTASNFELIDAGGSFVGSSQVAAGVDGGGEPVA